MTMTRRSVRILMGLLLMPTAMLCPSCRRGQGTGLAVVGSTSVQPFAEMLAEEFQKKHPDLSVEVQGGGSTAGIQALANGMAEIGMCSRELNKEEAKKFTPITIARDGLAIVVHPSNPINGLTRGQIRDIFSGLVTNWRQVGGPDAPIWPITREEGSGTREAFEKLVMGDREIARRALTQESNGSVHELVRHDPDGVGYMSLGLVGKDLKPLTIDGVAPCAAHVLDGTYTLARPFLFVVRGTPSPLAQRFIDFVRSPKGQHLLEKEGLVRVQ